MLQMNTIILLYNSRDLLLLVSHTLCFLQIINPVLSCFFYPPLLCTGERTTNATKDKGKEREAKRRGRSSESGCHTFLETNISKKYLNFYFDSNINGECCV